MTEPHLIDLEAGADLVASARQRRQALRETIDALEDAMSSPARQEGWCRRVSERVAALRTALEDHIREVEADGGLLEEIVESAPRLESAVSGIRNEHGDLEDLLDQLAGELVTLGDTAEPGQADLVRRHGMELIAALIEHRQRGADLVFDAYSVDIGGW